MRASKRTRWLAGVLCLALASADEARAEAADGPVEPPAELSVRGFGWLKNRELVQTLNLLLDDGSLRPTLDAGFIEDASLVLNSELVEAGFFAAQVEAKWTDTEGRPGQATLDAALSRPLARPLTVRALRLEAIPGVRAVVKQVVFEGLAEIPREAAEAFFRPDAGLYTSAAARAWSAARTRRAADQLREALRARGLAEATVEVTDTHLDRESGEVTLTVRVDEGPRWRVTDWRADVEGEGELAGGAPAGLVGAPWSRSLALDAAQTVRRRYFEKGHANVNVRWRAEPAAAKPAESARSESTAAEPAMDERAVTAVARVEPGPAWTIGAVRFEGVKKTRTALLETRVRNLAPGTPYDPAEVEAARLRLARLGVFRRLDLDSVPSEPDDGPKPDAAAGAEARDVVFHGMEEAGWQASWLIGYGSYEQIRGVLELSRTNLRGLAHRDRVEAGQSLKASRGEYRYTVPTLFNDTVEGSARVFGLRREEQSFIRLEYGAGLEGARELAWIRARGTAGVGYEVLRADDVKLGVSDDELTDTTVAAANLGLARDRRDNPIRPHEGHRWSLQSETALPELGGDVRYERVETAFSWHRPWGDERWLHAGLSHGFIAGGGDEVPVNKLFFPGGESSLRGYQEGEATQRDSTGRFVGVRSFWLLNLELEQAVTGRWTLVLFSDTLGTAVDLANWPGDEVLSTLGLGLRYQSPIGPLRVEYGRNLNPRAGDPAGTLHFSIGFPF